MLFTKKIEMFCKITQIVEKYYGWDWVLRKGPVYTKT